jgi:outer membrane biosynthesis protein TonB
VEKAKEKTWGVVASLVFHALLLWMFLLIVFKTPIPPFPDEGGSGYEVSFGNSENGFGETQPQDEIGSEKTENTNQDNVEEQVVKQNPNSSVEKVLTNTNSESTIEAEEGKTKTTENKNPESEKKPIEEVKKSNPFAMYKGKKKGAITSEGETNGKGDQGELNGSKNSLYHGKAGKGSGDGNGTGNGNGEGDGNGNGSGGKSGISFTLAGRKSSSLPVPKANFDEEGKVVVEITVDRNGLVVKAVPGVKGSTTTNSTLMQIAKTAAMQARFNSSNDAPDVQKGTIVYNFYLK